MKKPTKFKQETSAGVLPVGNQKRAERAVLKTLSYRAIFSYPLSLSQILNYLITKKPIPRSEVENSVMDLVESGRITVADGKFCLKDVKPVSWLDGGNNSTLLVEKAQKVSSILAKIPWIRLIGVTGSVAAFNAQEKDDIDILIITESRRLWLTRGFVFLVLKILGELRTDKSPGQKICPNILLDETNISWARKSRNIYVAHEIVMLHPVFDRGGTYLKFLQENSWVLRFFGNLKFGKVNVEHSHRQKWNVLDLLEGLARSLQLKYMAGKRTTEVTKDNLIHFNRDDHTKKFLSKFEKIKTEVL